MKNNDNRPNTRSQGGDSKDTKDTNNSKTKMLWSFGKRKRFSRGRKN